MPTCIKSQCRSPVACDGFGYCRELNWLPPADAGGRKCSEPVRGQDLIDWKHDHDRDERKHE